MNDIVEVVGLGKMLNSNGIAYEGLNFEDVYSQVVEQSPDAVLLRDLNNAIFDYFAELRLPASPTIYDWILLSLREKDLVVTFNWDPFLAEAFKRHRQLRALPQIAFLHGNVAVGVCQNDKRTGFMSDRCEICGGDFEPTPLLYPIHDKNYRQAPFIRDQWDQFDAFIQDTYFLTIFGYGAPKTDAAAVEQMRAAWERNGARELATIEIIDKKSTKRVLATWRGFIIREHYRVTRSFEGTSLDANPRRTCEALYAATMLLAPLDLYPRISEATTADRLKTYIQERIAPLIREEQRYKAGGVEFEEH